MRVCGLSVCRLGMVHIVFPQHFADISFFLATRLYCFAFVSLSLQKNVRDASSEHDTFRQTTWHNSSSPDAVFCRNRPPKTPAETIPKPCVPLSYWQNLHHGSPAAAFSIPLLLPFSCVMDAGAEAGVEGVVFAARRAREVRLLANRGLTRRRCRRLRVLFRTLLAELDLEFPIVVRADGPGRALPTLLSDVLVGETPVISSAHREVTTSTVPRPASRPHHTVLATTDTRNALHRRANSAVA